MKKIYKEIIGIFLSIIILILILVGLSKLLIPKWLNTQDNMHTFITKGFYGEEKNTIDVIFAGNSDTYRGVSPIEIYDQYGITSYNHVSAGGRIWTAYYMLLDSLKYQKPKVIFLSTDNFYSDSPSSSSNYMKVLGNMKLSKAKLMALNDSYAFNTDIKRKLAYMFPVFKFHSRIKDLSKNDFEYSFKNIHFAYKGQDLNTNINPYTDTNNYMKYTDEIDPIPNKVLIYFNKFIKACKDNNIEVVLYENVSPDSWNYKRHNGVESLAKANGLKYIDVNTFYKEIGIDFNSDLSDNGDHLNAYGAKKISKYLGQYIKDKYNIEDKRDNVKINKVWSKDVKKYKKDLTKLSNKK